MSTRPGTTMKADDTEQNASDDEALQHERSWNPEKQFKATSKEQQGPEASNSSMRPVSDNKKKPYTKQRHQGGLAGPDERRDAVSKYMERRRKATQQAEAGSGSPKFSNMYEYLRLAPADSSVEELESKEKVEQQPSSRPKRGGFGWPRGFTRPERERPMPEAKHPSKEVSARLSHPVQSPVGKETGRSTLLNESAASKSKPRGLPRSFARQARSSAHHHPAMTSAARKNDEQAMHPEFDTRTVQWPTLPAVPQAKVEAGGSAPSATKDEELTTAPFPACAASSETQPAGAITSSAKGTRKVAIRSRVADGAPSVTVDRSPKTLQESDQGQWRAYTDRLKRATTLGAQASSPAKAS